MLLKNNIKTSHSIARDLSVNLNVNVFFVPLLPTSQYVRVLFSYFNFSFINKRILRRFLEFGIQADLVIQGLNINTVNFNTKNTFADHKTGKTTNFVRVNCVYSQYL